MCDTQLLDEYKAFKSVLNALFLLFYLCVNSKQKYLKVKLLANICVCRELFRWMSKHYIMKLVDTITGELTRLTRFDAQNFKPKESIHGRQSRDIYEFCRGSPIFSSRYSITYEILRFNVALTRGRNLS